MIKIESIEFYNHYLFKNKKFSFTDENNKIYDTVVIAGENGSGKTTLLEEINSYFIGGNSTYSFGRTRIDNKTISRLNINISENRFYTVLRGERVFLHNAEIMRSINEYKVNIFSIRFIDLENSNSYIEIHDILNENSVNSYPRFDCIYSKVDINYHPMQKVQHTTNKKLDEKDTSFPPDLANDIQQLFVDITAQDNQDLAIWVKQNPGKIPPKKIQEQRIKRFNKAFYNIFYNKLKYSKVLDNINPVFIKNGREVEMNNLSSGEKQIVYRGAFLLRNINAIKGTIALIDEPEISMHPTWKTKIYYFYKRIFMDDNKQLSQLFFATHSDYVLDSALNDDNCLIISIEDNDVKKYSKNCVSILPTLTLAEIKYAIFHIYNEDFHILLYGELQKLYSKNTVKGMDDMLTQIGCKLNKSYTFKNQTYKTLPTYIRNCVDHPDSTHSYTKTELKQSIDYMVKIIKKVKKK